MVDELNASNRDEVLWAKIYSEVDGDDSKAKARYLRARAQGLQSTELSRSAGGATGSPIGTGHQPRERKQLTSDEIGITFAIVVAILLILAKIYDSTR